MLILSPVGDYHKSDVSRVPPTPKGDTLLLCHEMHGNNWWSFGSIKDIEEWEKDPPYYWHRFLVPPQPGEPLHEPYIKAVQRMQLAQKHPPCPEAQKLLDECPFLLNQIEWLAWSQTAKAANLPVEPAHNVQMRIDPFNCVGGVIFGAEGGCWRVTVHDDSKIFLRNIHGVEVPEITGNTQQNAMNLLISFLNLVQERSRLIKLQWSVV